MSIASKLMTKVGAWGTAGSWSVIVLVFYKYAIKFSDMQLIDGVKKLITGLVMLSIFTCTFFSESSSANLNKKFLTKVK